MHTLPIQLRFNDTDALGHVNNGTYMAFYDLGKIAYFEALFGRKIDPQNTGVVVAHLETDFLEPVFLNDDLAVQTRIDRIGNKSFTLYQQLIDRRTGIVKSTCKVVMVGYDFETRTTQQITDEWREAVTRYEQQNAGL